MGPPLLGRPVGRKADGTPLYDCRVCGGKGKLAIWTRGRRPGWYCVKCGKGGVFVNNELIQRVESSPPLGGRPWICEPITDLRDRRMKYLLRDRRMSYDDLRELRPHSGPDPWRVYLPVWEIAEPIYWISRSLFDEHQPKYLYPTGGTTARSRSSVLWGLHRLRRAAVDTVVLVEGVFDAVRRKNGLALLGSVISPPQCALLRGVKEITVMLDGDAGRKAGEVCRQLVRHTAAKVWRVNLPDWLEPDGFEKEEDWEWWIRTRQRVA